MNKAAQELGKKGGKAVLKKYGKQHFKNMAKKSGDLNAARGPEYFREMQKKSTEARMKKKKDPDSIDPLECVAFPPLKVTHRANIPKMTKPPSKITK